MTLIKWKEEFAVGIEEVDYEHKELIELINGLHDVMQIGADQVQVVELLGEIYAQIASHFALEEKMMRETHYPLFGEHKEDHEVLLDDLRDIMDEVEVDGEGRVEGQRPGCATRRLDAEDEPIAVDECPIARARAVEGDELELGPREALPASDGELQGEGGSRVHDALSKGVARHHDPTPVRIPADRLRRDQLSLSRRRDDRARLWGGCPLRCLHPAAGPAGREDPQSPARKRVMFRARDLRRLP